jgi:hypothetical protein
MEARAMADLPLHRRPDPELEAALRGLGDAIAWPTAAPADGRADIAAIVGARLAAAPADVAPPTSRRTPAAEPAEPAERGRALPRWTWRPARLAVVIAIIALLAAVALAGAAVLGLPGLRLIQGPVTVSPPPSLEPSRSPTPGAPGSTLGLGQPIALADLDARAGFHVTLPADPAIGAPDAAYIDASKGGQVTLVWASRAGLPDTLEPGVGLLVTTFRGSLDSGFISKALGSGTTAKLTLVDGARAYWLTGDPHFFFYQGPDGFVEDPRRWVGDVLLWSNGPITHRLETSFGEQAAIRIAESMP